MRTVGEAAAAGALGDSGGHPLHALRRAQAAALGGKAWVGGAARSQVPALAAAHAAATAPEARPLAQGRPLGLGPPSGLRAAPWA